MEIFQEFYTALTTANSGYNLVTITASVLVAVLLGLVVLLTHKFTGDEYKYNKNFGFVLLFVPATVALLISATTSVIAALSIAGVLAIVRYRSTLTDPRDLAFIFFSVAVGFAAGVKLYLAALIFVVIGVIVAVVFALIASDKNKNVKKTLKIAVPESIDYDGVFEPVLAKYTSSHKLVGVRVISGGTLIELTYSIKIKDTKEMKAFIDELRTLNANFKLSIQEYLPEPF